MTLFHIAPAHAEDVRIEPEYLPSMTRDHRLDGRGS